MSKIFSKLHKFGFEKLPTTVGKEDIKIIETDFVSHTALNKPGKRSEPKHTNLLKKLNIFNGLSPVRIVYFNKTQKTNWFVPWHQDLTIALKKQVSHPNFTNWTLKEGIPHCEAPIELLQRMVTIRIYLDETDETNGAMWVLPKSHLMGRLRQHRIKELVKNKEGVCLKGNRGDIYLFSPLILHRSLKSIKSNPRRALQIEMAPKEILPNPLEWYI